VASAALVCLAPLLQIPLPAAASSAALSPAGTFIPYASATACAECSGSAAGSLQCVPYQTESSIVAIVGGVVGSVAAVASLIAVWLGWRQYNLQKRLVEMETEKKRQDQGQQVGAV
jgi:hypothetical protein